MAGKLQNEDFKTEAQITGAGGSKSQLLNDTKIYVTADGINKTLDDAIVDGDIGSGGGGIATVNMTDWESFTPVWTNDTGLSATVTAFKRRVGDSLELYVQYLPGGTGTDNATLRMTLPDSLVIDTNKATADQGSSYLGSGYVDDGNRKAIAVTYRNTTSVEFYDATTLLTGSDPVLGDELASGNTLVFRATIPIDGWDAVNDLFISGTDNVAPARADATVNSTVIQNSTQYFLGFNTTDYDDDSLLTNVGSAANSSYLSTTYATIPVTGYYDIGAQAWSQDTDIDAGSSFTISIAVNGVLVRQKVHEEKAEVVTAPSTTWSISDLVYLQANDIVSIGFRNVSGADITLAPTPNYSWFTVKRVDKSPITGLGNEVAYVKDLKTSGTSGGSATANTIQTRDLNDLSGDSSFISLLSNQFTLQPGKYLIDATTPSYNTARHQCFLYNVTDSTYDIDGTSAYARNSDNSQTTSHLKDTITITSAKTYEIRHWTEVTRATNGLGIGSDLGAANPQSNEVFTQVEIRKLK